MKTNSKILSQYYTKPEVAQYFLKKIKEILNLDNYFIVEPSAGTGSFLNNNILENEIIAFDLEPKFDNIIKMNYFDFKPDNNKKYIVIGNPPFGKNSNLAVKFFNHSKYADYICFILPKTFKKISVTNKLDNNFHLVYEENVKENSFIFENNEYDVPCVFQIWKKESFKRNKTKNKTKSNYITFLKYTDKYDYLIRRVGALAGKVIENDFEKYSPNSHYYIKSSNNIKNLIKNKYKDLNEIAQNTAGNPSLSKHELIEYLENLIVF